MLSGIKSSERTDKITSCFVTNKIKITITIFVVIQLMFRAYMYVHSCLYVFVYENLLIVTDYFQLAYAIVKAYSDVCSFFVFLTHDLNV